MNKKKVVIIGVVAVAIIAIATVLVLTLGKKSDSKEKYRVVKVETTEGNVTVNRNNKDMDAFDDMMLKSKDEVSVLDESKLVLLMDSDKHMVAEANTKFKVTATGSEKNGAVKIELLEGKSLYRIDNKLSEDSSFEVTTPNATLSVRGTEFVVIYDVKSDSTFVNVNNGVVHVEYEGDAEAEDIPAGEMRIVTPERVFTDIDETAFADYDINVDATVIKSDENNSDGENGNASNNSSSGEGTSYNTYNEIRENIGQFIESNDMLTHDYVRRDYLYYDYDKDGEKEVIFILGFFKDEERDEYVDVVYLDHDESGIKVIAIVRDENWDHEFYAEYQNKLVRYSWSSDAKEAYLYYVDVRDDSLIYVLETAYDYLEPEKDGIVALPMYGDWEMILDQ